MIFRFGQHSLDTETAELKAGSVAVDLEPQTFLLLQFLIENRDRVVSKDEIFEAVWEGRIVADSTLGFAVNAVRQAVDDDGKAQAVIRTFPRRGYRFVASVVEAPVEEVIEEAGTDEPLAPRQRALSPSDEPPNGTAATMPDAARRWRMPAIAAAVVFIIAAGGLAWWQSWFERDQPLSALDKPSIAVLPLDNLSGEPEQEILVAGLNEDLNNALSRVPELLVISPNSTSAYKGKTVDVKHVAKELGVRHVVEGSVQRSGDRLRVTMQLIDGRNGANIWSERYDRNVTDLFDLQDEIVKKVLVELQVKLTAGDSARIYSRGTDNLEAWLLNVEATDEGFKFTPEANARARTLFQAAMDADPNWANPVGGLAWTYREAVRRGWSKSEEEDRRRGISLALRTIEMDPNEPLGYINLGNFYIESGRYEEGIALREKAIEIAPNHFFALVGLAWQLPFVGEEKRALDLYERAKTISPLHPAWLTASEAFALHVDGQHERAIEAYKKSIAGMNFPILHGRLAAVYAELGRMDEAREQIQILLTKKPDAKIQHVTQILKFQDTKRIDWYVDLLRAAGLPE
jgi:TolB-like protein/DNA-binding winged helix-turn-helix (wHTH) protein